jgi:hypothetical protein
MPSCEFSQSIVLYQLRVQLNVVRIAGSETTATSLGTLTYYLCKNPSKLQILREEVRASFKSADEINGVSTTKLPYLVACIKEGLRIFPPSTYGLPRISHGVTIGGHYVPKGVCFLEDACSEASLIVFRQLLQQSRMQSHGIRVTGKTRIRFSLNDGSIVTAKRTEKRASHFLWDRAGVWA